MLFPNFPNSIEIIDPIPSFEPTSPKVKLPANDAVPGIKKSPFSQSEHLNPPEVQRVVVEHIVKTSDLTPQIHKIRPFFWQNSLPKREIALNVT